MSFAMSLSHVIITKASKNCPVPGLCFFLFPLQSREFGEKGIARNYYFMEYEPFEFALNFTSRKCHYSYSQEQKSGLKSHLRVFHVWINLMLIIGILGYKQYNHIKSSCRVNAVNCILPSLIALM